jgi:hypothetical protein
MDQWFRTTRPYTRSLSKTLKLYIYTTFNSSIVYMRLTTHPSALDYCIKSLFESVVERHVLLVESQSLWQCSRDKILHMYDQRVSKIQRNRTITHTRPYVVHTKERKSSFSIYPTLILPHFLPNPFPPNLENSPSHLHKHNFKPYLFFIHLM